MYNDNDETRDWMKELTKGQSVLIHSYKHNGAIHRTWDQGCVLEVNDDYIVAINNKTLVTEADGRRWYTREPAICVFYKEYWFNIICMIRKNGVYFYCNLASPYLYDGEAIKYIDYDLDIKVFPDLTYKILDEDEYLWHQEKMVYPKEMDLIMDKAVQELTQMIQKQEGPFKPGFATFWYKTYLADSKSI